MVHVKSTPIEICRATAAHFDMPLAVLLGEARDQHAARPRQIAMVMCRDFTGRSLCNIARHFRRDHTTLLHAYAAMGPGTPDGQKTASDRGCILARAQVFAAERVARERDWVAKLHAGIAVLPPKPARKQQITVYDPRLFRKSARGPAKPNWYARLGPSEITVAPEKLRAGRA